MPTMGRWAVMIAVMLLTSPHLFSLPPDSSFQGKLEVRIGHYASGSQSLVKAILELAYRYQLATAIQYVDRASVQQPLSVRLDNAPTQEVIKALAAAAGYRVQFSDGLVQVYSPVAREDSSNPLNTLIDDFDIADLTIQEAEARLLGALVNKASPGASFGGDVPYGAEPQRKLTLRLKKARVYEILDAIVVRDGSSIWIAVPASGNTSSLAQGPPWAVYDLRSTTEKVVLERLSRLFP